MQSRMTHPEFALLGAMEALTALDRATDGSGVPNVTRKLMHLRASQRNGCSFCVEMHAQEPREAGETDARIFTVAAWRETPYFTPAERAPG